MISTLYCRPLPADLVQKLRLVAPEGLMYLGREKILNRFWEAMGGSVTGNVPLHGGNLTVSLRELDRMSKQGLKIDPVKRARCLFVEGHILLGRIRYFVHYVNYENGLVEWGFRPDVDTRDLTIQPIELTRGQFEDYLLDNVLPIFFEKSLK